MTLWGLVLREIGHRRVNFALSVASAAIAVGSLLASLGMLRQHDLQTEIIVSAKQAEMEKRLAELQDDFRKLTLQMGFNVLILPKDQNLGDLYADDFAVKTMPEEYAERLAKSRVVTINHVVPSLQQKVKWPEKERTILLMGVRGVIYLQSAKQKPLIEPVKSGSMVVGHELAQSLGLKPGEHTELMGRSFLVDRINPERGNKDDITVWIDLAEAQQMLGKPGRINGILALDCTCDTLDRLALIRAEISKILPDTQVIEFVSQALARAEARGRAETEAREALAAEVAGRLQLRRQREASAALLVPLVALGSGLWIAMLTLANVHERRAEIGILRAVGLRSGQVLSVFLARAALAGVAGAALGFAVSRFGPAPLNDARTLAAILIGAPLLAAVSSWLPALAAAKQDPAEALRHHEA